MKKEEIKIAYFKKEKNFPAGIYRFKKLNIWYPVVYFRKAKHTTKKEFDAIINYLVNRMSAK